MLHELFLLIVLTAIYILTIAGLFFLFLRIGLSRGKAVLVAFLSFGLISGALAWAWPFDSAAYPNVYAMLLGDELYINATTYWGKPGSLNPHADIPWFLRVPQIYFFSSVVLFGSVGWFVQTLYNERMEKG